MEAEASDETSELGKHSQLIWHSYSCDPHDPVPPKPIFPLSTSYSPAPFLLDTAEIFDTQSLEEGRDC